MVLSKDYRQLGDKEPYREVSAVGQIIKTFFLKRDAVLATLYNLSFWMMTVVMAGYLVISLGREFSDPDSSTLQWSFMIAFLFGYSGVGWAIKGHLLPRLIERLNRRSYVLLFFGLNLIFSLAYPFFNEMMSLSIKIGFIFVYGAFFHVSTSAIQNISMNHLMNVFKQQDYATALSLQNIPGFLWVGLYSLYLAVFREGAPSVIEAFYTVALISVVYLLVGIVLEDRKSIKKVPS